MTLKEDINKTRYQYENNMSLKQPFQTPFTIFCGADTTFRNWYVPCWYNIQ